MSDFRVGYIVGSLAKQSINRKLAGALVRLAPASLTMTEIGLEDLPLYSYDYDANFPPAARKFKDAVAASEAILFVAGVQPVNPGRPQKRDRLGESAVWHILAFCNSPLMNTVEAYIQLESGVIADDGRVTNGETETFLRDFMAEFATFLGRVYTVLPRNQ